MTLTLLLTAFAIMAAFVLFKPLFAASADAVITMIQTEDTLELPIGANVTHYKGAWVGLDPAGYTKAFEPGDRFGGKCASYATGGATAGVNYVTVYIKGAFEETLTSVALTDVGKPVFATADNTLALTGHPDAYVGRITRYVTTNTCQVTLKRPGDVPDSGFVEIVADGSKLRLTANILTATAETIIDGKWRADAIGAGIAGATQGFGASGAGYCSMLIDNDNEAENVSFESPQCFNITKGVTFEGELTLQTAGGAATDDLDFGLMGLSGGITDTERADMNAATAGLLSALFHVDTNGLDLAFSSDDNSAPVSATDTLVNIVLQTYNTFKIVVRPAGTVELWVDGVRKLSTTAFSVGAAGLLAAIVNIEKSTGTGVPEVRFKKLRVAGALA